MHTNEITFSVFLIQASSYAAKSFMKRGTLLDFQYDFWMKTGSTGFPRMVKYHKQLNEIAIEKATNKAA